MLLLCLALGAFLITTYSVQDWGFVDFTLAIVGLICYALAIYLDYVQFHHLLILVLAILNDPNFVL
jgi:hypothetical protein